MTVRVSVNFVVTTTTTVSLPIIFSLFVPSDEMKTMGLSVSISSAIRIVGHIVIRGVPNKWFLVQYCWR